MTTNKPGFYDISERDYHADKLAPVPSLSSSIAKILLTETARHAALVHPRLNADKPAERDPSRPAEIGTAAHKFLTGKGAQVVLIDAPTYQGKLAKEMRAEAYEAGHAPILIADHAAAMRIETAVRMRLGAIPETQDVLKTAAGEQVMLWQDTGGIWCRGMIDLWHAETLTAYDIKSTARGLSDRDLQALITGGWDVQAGLYIRGLTTLLPEHAGRFKWRWIVVQQDEPHEVRVIEADRLTMEMGDRKAAMAIATWRHCMVTGEWPGYPAEITTIEYPSWAMNSQLERELNFETPGFEPLGSVPRASNDGPMEVIYGEQRTWI